MFSMRFDMRAPDGVATMPGLYEAAIEMAAWAEDRGGVAAVISEHHASPDGYIPSPLLLASAMAARTQHLPITIAAALMPFYDPIRLAEDMAVLDIMSKGRVSYVMALGYRPEEFELFGVDWTQRGAVAEQKLGVLLQAVTGEPFEYEGRQVQIMPSPTGADQHLVGRWHQAGGAPRRAPRDRVLRRERRPRIARGLRRRGAQARTRTGPVHAGAARTASRPRSSPTTSTARGTSSVRT